LTAWTINNGENMARPDVHNDATAPAFVPDGPHTRYLVARQEDGWVIKFNGEEYGPYKSEREALLFAIDAAHKLGEQGGEAQVLLADESGDVQPAWTYGQDPYPPRHV
jgi:hypothetical protein